ncbi:MAG: NADH dehydrogenase (quinone) subunit G [Alphaproteobacteria bacterium]|nr:MAG: NADH dehydrogenase (quinone) subunit G [Alphaproteobacteria bacterium]
MAKFILDNHELEVESGTTILKAARAIAIDIPTFCYQDRLSTLASCRMCLVEVEDHRKLEPACSTPVTEGMVIHTRSPKVVATREDMLEILLANHPLDCPICDKSGECELQDTVFDYGKGESRLHDPKRVFRTRDIELNKVIIFNADRCIQCQRCVRVCEEIVGEVALGTAERGLDSEITGVGNSLSDCSHCGNCIEVCPVGALMSSPYRYSARPWDLERTDTICTMCGTGCSLTIETRDGELMRVKSAYDTGINGELLCAKGRFGFDVIDGAERLTTPLIRKGGILTPVSWDEAISFISTTARSIQNNGGHIQGLISARQTNEVAYMFQKLIRHVFTSGNLSTSTRFTGLKSSQSLTALAQVMGHRYDRQPLRTLLQADCILLLGAAITEENPVSGYLIREILRDRPTPLFIASARPCGLDDIARASFRLLPGHEGQLLARLTTEVPPPDDPVMAEFISRAREALTAADSITLLVGTDFLRAPDAADCLKNIDQAALMLERTGKKVHVQFLFDRPNQLGVWDMGCLTDINPGWRYAKTHNLTPVPYMIYVLGTDPCAVTDLQTACLIVQDSHMSRTAELATVVLPAPSYGEESGTYTNNEGRVQKLRAIRPPGVGILPKVDVFSRISAAMGKTYGPARVEQIYAEITREIPAYRDLDIWSDKDDFGLTRSLPAEVAMTLQTFPGSFPDPVLHAGYMLITGDSLFQSGLLTRQSEILTGLGDGPYVEMNPGKGITENAEGYEVTVSRKGASLTARLKVNTGFPMGVVYIPENMLSGPPARLLSAEDYPSPVEVTIQPTR